MVPTRTPENRSFEFLKTVAKLQKNPKWGGVFGFIGSGCEKTVKINGLKYESIQTKPHKNHFDDSL